MYLAEFSFPGTTELVNELFIKAASEAIAHTVAQVYAAHWGIELYSLTALSEQQATGNLLGAPLVIAPAA
jgi:hypothetical protein